MILTWTLIEKENRDRIDKNRLRVTHPRYRIDARIPKRRRL